MVRQAEGRIVQIGNARGRIALYLTESEATDLAHLYGGGDRAYDELLQAVAKAYPPEHDEESAQPEEERQWFQCEHGVEWSRCREPHTESPPVEAEEEG